MLDLKTANYIVNHIIDAASKRDDLKPMTAVVIDAGGAGDQRSAPGRSITNSY